VRVVFRADAGVEQGTGHVMRCLTLADELATRGHEVHLMTGPISIAWLGATVRAADLVVHECFLDELPLDRIQNLDADWLIVDSYRIESSRISAAALSVPVLAIVDGDDRSIEASLYLDQNLGAEALVRRPGTADRYLAGSDYALVRRGVLDARRTEPWHLRGPHARVLCFMGGTDSTGTIVSVAASLSRLARERELELTVIAPERHHEAVQRELAANAGARILAPTPELPALMAAAEIIISAAGTSAWDICALGVPAVLVAVVDNQQASEDEAVKRGLTLGLDAVGRGQDALEGVRDLLEQLLDDEPLRKRLSVSSRATFDGNGASRVADRLERTARAKDDR
jgi:spore coat polysaccharide biosynthesis predicted glycosyltransferase SpsG